VKQHETKQAQDKIKKGGRRDVRKLCGMTAFTTSSLGGGLALQHRCHRCALGFQYLMHINRGAGL
jgi:hypothetical protein